MQPDVNIRLMIWSSGDNIFGCIIVTASEEIPSAPQATLIFRSAIHTINSLLVRGYRYVLSVGREFLMKLDLLLASMKKL